MRCADDGLRKLQEMAISLDQQLQWLASKDELTRTKVRTGYCQDEAMQKAILETKWLGPCRLGAARTSLRVTEKVTACSTPEAPEVW